MSDLSIIKSLYWALADTHNYFRPEGELYEKTVQEQGDALGKLEQSLSGSQKMLFEDYANKDLNVHTMLEEEAFRHGFSFGVRLASEAYRLGKDDMVSIFEKIK